MIQSKLNAWTEMAKASDTSERKTTMSFVGLVLCEDGILGFGDSKGSKLDEMGNLQYAKERGCLTKVFKNEHFILAASNHNQFLTATNRWINLEDWMAKHIPQLPTQYELLTALLEDMRGNINNQQYNFQFLIGAKNENGYYVQHAIIENNRLIFESRNWNKDIYSSGHSFYCSRVNALSYTPFTVEAGQTNIPERIERLIRDADRYDSYNPVGLPIKTEIFQIKKEG